MTRNELWVALKKVVADHHEAFLNLISNPVIQREDSPPSFYPSHAGAKVVFVIRYIFQCSMFSRSTTFFSSFQGNSASSIRLENRNIECGRVVFVEIRLCVEHNKKNENLYTVSAARDDFSFHSDSGA